MNLKKLEAYYNSPEYINKLKQRVEAMQKMADPYERQALILDVYSVDPVKFIEHFCFVTADKLDGSPKPFFLFEYQKKLLYRLQELENSNPINGDFLVDKPREMGISWTICAFFLWRFLFTPNYSAFLMSRSEAEVDCGTRQPNSSLFGKIRWLMDKLPPYLIPENFQPKGTRGTSTDSNLKLINPQINSLLIGSSTNSNAGRSRRYRTVFIDEIFAIDRFNEVLRSLESVSKIKICASTVRFGRNFENFKNYTKQNDNYLSLNWKDHPFKDQEWYDEMIRKAEEMDDPDLLREVDPSYAVSSKSQYYPGSSKITFEPLTYVSSLPLYVSLDLGGKQDLTVLIWWQFDGTRFRCLTSFSNYNKPLEYYLPFLNPHLQENPAYYTEPQLKLLNQVKGWLKPAAWFGEADHFAARHPTNTSSAQEMGKHGIRLMKNDYAIKHEPRRTAMEAIFPRMVVNETDDGAMRVFDAISQSRYANHIVSTTENLKPVHDKEIADYRAAAENFAVNIPRILRSQRADISQNQDTHSFASSIIKYLRI